MKDIPDKPRAKITLKGETFKDFSETQSNIRLATPDIFIQHFPGCPSSTVRQEKETKTIKEECSYLYSQTAYVANSKESIKQLLE